MRRSILWTGGARVFTVAVALLLAVMLWIVTTTLPTAKAASGSTITVSVPANKAWTDTGVDVQNGDQLRIEASGMIKITPSDPGKSPDGDQNCVASNSFVAPGLHCYALIGGIGGYPPQEVGNGGTFKISLPKGDTGRLYLGVNDDYFNDNSGSWTAHITVADTSGQDNTKPGGTWVSPAKNFVVTGKNTLHFKAHAYDNTGGSGVAKVAFTAWWPGTNPNVWHTTCTKFLPTSRNVYECDWNPSGVPNGPLMASFDVYDKAGNKNLAPNGLRTGKVERDYAFKFPWDSSKLLNLTSGPHAWGNSPMRSGLDFSDQNREKSTRVLAMADGKVTWAGAKQGACRSLSGEKLACNMVQVSHSNGWEVWYVHLSSFASDIDKQCIGKPSCSYPVNQGQWLGNEGDSGAPGQVHLHIELRKDGKRQEWSEVPGGIEGWVFHKGEDCSSYNPDKAAYDEKTGKQQTKACENGDRGGFMSYGSIHALREYQDGPRYWIHSTNHEP